MGLYEYENDTYHDADEITADELTPADFAEAIQYAVDQRVSQHELANQAASSEWALVAAQNELSAQYADFNTLRPKLDEKFQELGYHPHGFATPSEAFVTLEYLLHVVASEENSRRAEAARDQPAKDWEAIKAAHDPTQEWVGGWGRAQS